MTQPVSPYAGLPATAFWRTGVVEAGAAGLQGLFTPTFAIDHATRIASFGSCFAQHITRHLRLLGCSVLDAEPPPVGLPPERWDRFGYGVYSARYGNIYTAAHLLQLVRETLGKEVPGDPVWSLGSERGERVVDSQRPSIEPDGLASGDEVALHREVHLHCVRSVLTEAEVFVITLGLTEAWEHRPSGTVFPTAPGVIAGSFDPSVYRLRTYTAAKVAEQLDEIRRLICGLSGRACAPRFVLTVSPVPLTATATGQHVLKATSLAKSVLRVAAEEIATRYDDADYFPAYEIITNPAARGSFFDDNARTVSQIGVQAVMRTFTSAYRLDDAPASERTNAGLDSSVDLLSDDGPLCDDVLLEPFAP